VQAVVEASVDPEQLKIAVYTSLSIHLMKINWNTFMDGLYDD
jgi:hypothetical protein